MRKATYTLIFVFILMAFLPVAFHGIPLFRTPFWSYLELAVIAIAVILSFSRIRRR